MNESNNKRFVKANYTWLNAITKDEVCELLFEYDTVYGIRRLNGEKRCLPKCMFDICN